MYILHLSLYHGKLMAIIDNMFLIIEIVLKEIELRILKVVLKNKNDQKLLKKRCYFRSNKNSNKTNSQIL